MLINKQLNNNNFKHSNSNIIINKRLLYRINNFNNKLKNRNKMFNKFQKGMYPSSPPSNSRIRIM